MRYLKILVLSLAVMGLTVGSALGGVITVNGGPYRTAAEGIGITCTGSWDLDGGSGSNTPLGNGPFGASIGYRPEIALAINDVITFTLTNAIFRNSNYFLVVDEAEVGADIDGDGASNELLEVGNMTAGGFGSSSVSLRIVNIPVQANWNLYLISSNVDCNTGGPPGTPPNSRNYNHNIVIQLNCGIGAGSNIRIGVTSATNVGGTPIPGATTGWAEIIQVRNQFEISTSAGSSVIDVTSAFPRRSFLEEETPDDIITSSSDTDLRASSGRVEVTNDLTIDDLIRLGTFRANLVLTLGGAANTYGVLDLVTGARTHLDGDGVETTDGPTNYNFTGTGPITATYSTFPVQPTWEDDVYVRVNGSILSPQVWPLTVRLDFEDTRITDPAVSSPSFLTWTINGYQAIIPYITTVPAFTTICIANNTASNVADVMVDILSSESGTVVNSLDVGQIPGQSTARIDFSGTSIINEKGGMATVPLAIPERYSARITITSDPNLTTVNCIQLEPTGSKRMVPVLTNEGSVEWRQ